MCGVVVLVDSLHDIEAVIADVVDPEHVQILVFVFTDALREVQVNSGSNFVENQARVVQYGLW